MAVVSDGEQQADSRALLVASLTSEPSATELQALSGRAEILEVRADLVGDLNPEGLRRDFTGRLLYTLRSPEEGGAAADGGVSNRGERLMQAAEGYDSVDLEMGRDLETSLLERVPPEKRILSWHGPSTELQELRRRCDEMLQYPAELYKLVPAAEKPAHGLAPLALLAALGRDDVVAFSTGRSGFWTRLLAPRLGAPVVFGSVGEEAAAPGQLSVARLRRDYGLPRLGPIEALFGIVGSLALHSLSPRLHNAAYRALGLPCLYLPFEAAVFGDFWLDVIERHRFEALGFQLAGLSVTAPFKEIALAVSGAASPLAERLGSANSLVRRGRVWEAESTDGVGVVEALRRRGLSLANRRSAVVGAGGAGRAAAHALKTAGAAVTLVNRGVTRGSRAAYELGLPFVALADFDPGAYDLVVNATPLGSESASEMPFETALVSRGAWFVDLAYRADGPTALGEDLARRNVSVIDGREVLLYQAVPQFGLMTGEQLPLDLARQILELDGE